MPPAPLEVLYLDGTGFGDPGMGFLADALKAGRLGSQLKELTLGRNIFHDNDSERPCHITDRGVKALVDALAQGQQHVTRLREVYLNAPALTEECFAAFLDQVPVLCPALELLIPRPAGSRQGQCDAGNRRESRDRSAHWEACDAS